ncbi:N-acetylmuramoyl-L-alanine amidase [Aestuariibius insulae]|uniref:N-acetylmuramoyl-L-alanine amidase n=1 Tax=Aestuariibius insulae TaxID=2058287 RepID=UPI00345E845A
MSLSPNFGPRRDGAAISLVVLHFTGMESHAAARARLCDPDAEVSAHYLISETGLCEALVAEDQRAWHAGQGRWGDVSDVNSASIGIELTNDGAQPFAEPQMAALTGLLGEVLTRYDLGPEAVIGHSDMAPHRKFDPGPRFDWRRLAREGVSVWPDMQDADPSAFGEAAARFGYPVDLVSNEDLLDAVRLRFRPWAAGPLDEFDSGLVADLAERYPCPGASALTG